MHCVDVLEIEICDFLSERIRVGAVVSRGTTSVQVHRDTDSNTAFLTQAIVSPLIHTNSEILCEVTNETLCFRCTL